jgi:hypothetical protein
MKRRLPTQVPSLSHKTEATIEVPSSTISIQTREELAAKLKAQSEELLQNVARAREILREAEEGEKKFIQGLFEMRRAREARNQAKAPHERPPSVHRFISEEAEIRFTRDLLPHGWKEVRMKIHKECGEEALKFLVWEEMATLAMLRKSEPDPSEQLEFASHLKLPPPK